LVRGNSIITCNRDDNMGSYHITLAYKYKNIDDQTAYNIKKELETINLLFEDQPIILNKPFVCYFKDMTEFKLFSESLVDPTNNHDD